MRHSLPTIVFPVQAGIQRSVSWIPAFAGTTDRVSSRLPDTRLAREMLERGVRLENPAEEALSRHHKLCRIVTLDQVTGSGYSHSLAVGNGLLQTLHRFFQE